MTEVSVRREIRTLDSLRPLYECKKCPRKFSGSPEFREHSLTHMKTTQFTCIHCQKEFNGQRSLRSHMFVHTGLVHCPKCNKGLKSQATLQLHLNRHANQNSERQLKGHNNGTWHKCNHCPRSFRQQRYLTGHLKTHGIGIGTSRLDSVQENDIDESIVDLVEEVEEVEPDDPVVRPLTHTCRLCPASFTSLVSLRAHRCTRVDAEPDQDDVEVEVGPNHQFEPLTQQCPFCPASFSSLLILDAHRVTHVGDAVAGLDGEAFVDNRDEFGSVGAERSLKEGRKKCRVCRASISEILEAHTDSHTTGQVHVKHRSRKLQMKDKERMKKSRENEYNCNIS